MQQVKLSAIARMNLTGIIGSFEGNVGEIRMLTKVLKKVELSTEERASIKLVEELLPGGKVLSQWDTALAEKIDSTEIDLEDAEFKKVKAILEQVKINAGQYEAWGKGLFVQFGLDVA